MNGRRNKGRYGVSALEEGRVQQKVAWTVLSEGESGSRDSEEMEEQEDGEGVRNIENRDRATLPSAV